MEPLNSFQQFPMKEKIICCESDRAQEQTAQGGYGVFFGEIQNPPGCFPEQPTIRNLLLAGCWMR